jgi:hypothetical protein
LQALSIALTATWYASGKSSSAAMTASRIAE